MRWQLNNDLLVNFIGAGILGLLVGYRFKGTIKLLFGFGFCGALTTFSTYALDIVKYFSQGKSLLGIGYILTMNLLCFLMCMAGIKLAQLVR